MEANELMLGDWVRIPSELNRFKQIKSTFDLDESVLYQPVQITGEILEKNGFKKKMGGTFELVYNPKGTYIHMEYNPVSGHLIANDRWFIANEIHFVHELQHALKMAKTDIPIDLN